MTADPNGNNADPSKPARTGFLGWLLNNATAIGVFLTFIATIVTSLLTYHNKTILDQTTHAEKFADSFNSNFKTMTAFIYSKQRGDEQATDMALTALDDAAESTDDRIAMLTIAARMLNATDCPSSGEATARFLSIIVTQIRDHRYPDSDTLLKFVRTPAFLNLASDDITREYDNDDSNGPLDCGSTTKIAEQQTAAKPHPPPSPTPMPPMYTAGAGDARNYSTLWGEQASWNDAKNELFQLLRPEAFDGWIHIATWEQADHCVDANGKLLQIWNKAHTAHRGAECTPIRIHYTSTPFTFQPDDPHNADRPFWLGRARFLRDAAPRYYRHEDDTTMNYRGALGQVIGVVNYGECVRPRGRPRYVDVTTKDGLRRFYHVWLEVGPADPAECPDTPGK